MVKSFKTLGPDSYYDCFRLHFSKKKFLFIYLFYLYMCVCGVCVVCVWCVCGVCVVCGVWCVWCVWCVCVVCVFVVCVVCVWYVCGVFISMVTTVENGLRYDYDCFRFHFSKKKVFYYLFLV